MRTIITAAAMAGGLALSASAALAQEAFNINFIAGSEQIVGTVVLASGTTGDLTGNEVLGYTISSTLGDPIAFSVSGGAGTASGGGLLIVQNGDLVFNPLPWVSLGSLPGCTTCCQTCDANPTQSFYFDYLAFLGPGFNSFGDEHGSAGPGTPQGVGFSGGPNWGDSWGLETGTVLGEEVGGTAAPEIDPSGAGAALTMLAGVLLVLRGRRRSAS
jgi:hypothetical protein